MFQGWRIKIREAEEAHQQGLLDQAHQMLLEGALQRFAPGKNLSARVAESLADRALQRFSCGEIAAAMRDFAVARNLAGETGAVLACRQKLIQQVEREVQHRFESGAVGTVLSQLEEMEKRDLASEALQQLHEVTQRMRSVEQLCRRGKFAEAKQQVAAAIALRNDWQCLRDRQVQVQEQQVRHRKLTEKLHQAVAGENWSKVLKMAERLLEIAPENSVAQDARRRAWDEVGGDSAEEDRDPTVYWSPFQNRRQKKRRSAGGVTQESSDCPARFILWIDAVGGYLVCLSEEVMIGQAVPTSGVTVPIKADLSRRHAKVKRHGEGYLVEPLGKTRVAGQVIRETTLLTDGDEIELGEGVKLRFRQPHALSVTARLDFVSHHKTHPTADAVLLMAESCVLGPHWQNHVVARHWSDDVVLFRQGAGLFCRAVDAISVDGQWHDGKGRIGTNSHVCGEEFSMSLEEVMNA